MMHGNYPRRPFVSDGPVNSELFTLYVEKVLAPALRPGDLVVLDNLGSHKGKAVRAIVHLLRMSSRRS
jgi:transposase